MSSSRRRAGLARSALTVSDSPGAVPVEKTRPEPAYAPQSASAQRIGAAAKALEWRPAPNPEANPYRQWLIAQGLIVPAEARRAKSAAQLANKSEGT